MIEFIEIEGKPDEQVFNKIADFYKLIFENTELNTFEKRISESESLLTVLAVEEEKIIGFKIGYKIEPKKFYSWIGGVDAQFRNLGIAAELMKRQHLWCIKNNFDIVRTKTKNKFKAMLILNIKHDFDIIDVYRDKKNELKIVLEKPLSKN